VPDLHDDNVVLTSQLSVAVGNAKDPFSWRSAAASCERHSAGTREVPLDLLIVSVSAREQLGSWWLAKRRKLRQTARCKCNHEA